VINCRSISEVLGVGGHVPSTDDSPNCAPDTRNDTRNDTGGAASDVGPLVVKLGGAAVDDPAQCPWLWEALRELHEAHPGGLVLVHGGAVAVDRQLASMGLTSERREGIRLTPAEHIGAIVGVLAGSLNTALVGWLRRSGAPAVGLTLGDGGLCRVIKSTRFAFDPGFVGEIIGGSPRVVDALLAADLLPVLSSIGIDDLGQALNINADEAAAGVAAIVGASGLLLLTDTPGVFGRDGTVIESLDAETIETLIAEGVIAGGMIPKVRGALEAARSAGVPVTIASWRSSDDIQRLAQGRRAGTRVLPGRRANRLEEPELPALRSSIPARASVH